VSGSTRKGKAAWVSIWSAYRYRAKQKGFDWQMTREEFDALLHADCHYCGRSPELAQGNLVTIKGVRYHYSGVDRRDNAPVYSKETTVPCCAICNTAKSTLKEEEFIEHVKKIYDNKFGKR
jgi:hypothetical protein